MVNLPAKKFFPGLYHILWIQSQIFSFCGVYLLVSWTVNFPYFYVKSPVPEGGK